MALPEVRVQIQEVQTPGTAKNSLTGYQYINMLATVDLFRVPENTQGPEAGPISGLTYYSKEGPEDKPYPEQLPGGIGRVGNDLILPDSEESHLWTGEGNIAGAHRDGNNLCFIFTNLGVLANDKYVACTLAQIPRVAAYCIGSAFDVVAGDKFLGLPLRRN
ncbi:hypothetical protein C8R43DRAFT_1113353 [Mycena crocata]|nr:hypothetical protein C8R43DRAFT_1113353 [Mycena crocata]